MNVVLHSTVAGFSSQLKLTVKADDELEKLVFKLLQLPDGKFEDCYELEYLLPNKDWDSLLSFSDVKDGMEIRVLSKAFSKVVDLPSAAEGRRCGVVVDLSELYEYLGVRVVGASNLESKGKSKHVDPFVVLYFSKNKANKWKTVASHNTGDPVWNENFILPVPGEIISEDGKISESLTVRLFTSPKGSDQLLGKGTISLSNLRKSERQTLVVELSRGKVELEAWWFEDLRLNEPPPTTKFRGSVSCCSTFVTPPPRDSVGKSCKEKETKKGDILIKKEYNQQCPVKLEQKPFYVSRGTKYSTEALIAADDGGSVISGFSGDQTSFKVVSKFPESDFVVYRALDTAYAKEAAEWASDVAKNHDVKYSTKSCLGSASTEYNATSKQRSKKLIGKDLPAEMMCSDFVCTAYQCRPEEPKVKLDAQRVIPMKLEDYLNKHPEDFIFLGKITRKDTISFNVENK